MEKSQNVGTKNAFTPSLFVEETSLKILNKQFSTPYLSVRAMFDSCFNVGNDEMLTTVREKIKKMIVAINICTGLSTFFLKKNLWSLNFCCS